MTVGELYVVVAGLAFLAIFVTGFRLRGLKKARNTLLLTAHKILSLATVALLGVTAYRASGSAAGLATDDWAAVLGAGALFAITMATGGVISAQPAAPRAVRTLHRAGSVLTTLVSALALYLLLVRM